MTSTLGSSSAADMIAQHRHSLSAVHGAPILSGKVVIDGVPVVAAPAKMLGELPAVLGPERVVGLAAQARVRFHAAA
jgi:hypothetical protein